LARRSRGVGVALTPPVAELTIPTPDRRTPTRGDRRKRSRGGRRAGDPRTDWRRLAWLFAAYACYVSVRSLPATAKRSISETIRKILGQAPVGT
jgi:hypothetical protein